LPLFQIENLSFRYPAAAPFELNRLSLTVEKGDLIGFLGPNGAGKSTLLRLLAGLLKPAEGKILFEGKCLSDYPVRERAKKIAFVPQSVHFQFPLSVSEIVEMGRHPYLGRFEALGARDKSICERALKLCDAWEFKDRSFEQLSGGERQRVLLASALAQTPQVLLLDEPTLSLDMAHQILLFEIIRKLHREEGVTVAVATHELNLAGQYLDKLILMREGKIAAQGPPKRVLTKSLILAVHGVKVQAVRGAGAAPYFVPRREKGKPS
jgi:iron complex transport system ATP-binding protein